MATYDVTTPTSTAAVTSTATAARVGDRTASSTANVTSSASREKVIAATAASTVVVSSAITAQLAVDRLAPSSAIVVGSATASLVANVLAPSAAIAYGTARYDGEEMDAWATNLLNQAIGKYTGFDFNSFANVGGRLFGFSDAGIFEITGSTDAGQPIPFFLMSESHSKLGGESGLGMLMPHTAYLVGDLPESPSVVDMFIMTDDDELYSYPVGETDTRMSTARVLLGRGLRSRFLRYGIYGTAHESVEIASITIKGASSARNV